MARAPILGSDKRNPNNTTRLEAGANNMFAKKVRQINREIVAIVRDLDYTVEIVNASTAIMNNRHYVRSWGYEPIEDNVCPIYKKKMITNAERFYNYNLDQRELLALGDTINDIVNRIMMTTMPDRFGDTQPVTRFNIDDLWLFSGYVEQSYQKGTRLAFRNIANQVSASPYADQTITSLFNSEPYRRRIEALAAREFELMEGFNADTVKDVRRILSEGIATGQSPQRLARELTGRVGVNEYRGRRIAQTEINVAHRRARQAEARSAEREYGIRTMALWQSALKSTTRPHHASRHGKYYTWEQVNEFYARDANAIFCYCTQTEQVVDSKGKPINTGARDILVKQRKTWDEQQKEAA